VKDATGRVFDALADSNRRYVVEALAQRGTATATELASELQVTRQAVAKHFAALSEAGLVESRREGRETRYELTPQPLAAAVDWMALGYLVLFATAIAQQAWLFGVKGIGPSRASVLGNLTPVAAVVLSAVMLKEPVGTSEILGIVLILAGVWVVNRQTSRLTK
jgi:DNA-binding transcriptional ArsR family regulator